MTPPGRRQDGGRHRNGGQCCDVRLLQDAAAPAIRGAASSQGVSSSIGHPNVCLYASSCMARCSSAHVQPIRSWQATMAFMHMYVRHREQVTRVPHLCTNAPLWNFEAFCGRDFSCGALRRPDRLYPEPCISLSPVRQLRHRPSPTRPGDLGGRC